MFKPDRLDFHAPKKSSLSGTHLYLEKLIDILTREGRTTSAEQRVPSTSSICKMFFQCSLPYWEWAPPPCLNKLKAACTTLVLGSSPSVEREYSNELVFTEIMLRNRHSLKFWLPFLLYTG